MFLVFAQVVIKYKFVTKYVLVLTTHAGISTEGGGTSG